MRAKVKRDLLNDAYLAGLDWSTVIHKLKSSTSTLLGRLMPLFTFGGLLDKAHDTTKASKQSDIE